MTGAQASSLASLLTQLRATGTVALQSFATGTVALQSYQPVVQSRLKNIRIVFLQFVGLSSNILGFFIKLVDLVVV